METRKIDNPEYTLKRSDRRSIGITIDRDGSIIVRAPLHEDPEKIARFVIEKRVWIHQKLATKKAINHAGHNREFVNGQGFLYLGKSYRLRFIDNDQTRKFEESSDGFALKLRHGYFELHESQKHNARNHFILWYKKQTEAKLKKRMPRYDKRVGVRVEKHRVSDLRHRWASLSRNGVVNFNWRSVMAPIWVFDYILVHEMAHMIVRGHSKEFWSLISRVMPDYKEHILWLNEHGADLDL